MWHEPINLLALLELHRTGCLKKRTRQRSAYGALADLPWTIASTRRDEIQLRGDRRFELMQFMDQVAPEWSVLLDELLENGLPLTPVGLRRLGDCHRARILPELPERLNKHTALSVVGPHSKAALSAAREQIISDVGITRDGVVRIRPPEGLKVIRDRDTLDLDKVADVLGEVSIPERALIDGLSFAGPLRGIVLIENLGAWRDFPVVTDLMLAHVPGWDTVTCARLLSALPDLPVVHFGDIDPNGVRIFRHLSGFRADLRWLVPSFWEEYVETHALSGEWPQCFDFVGLPKWVQRVAEDSCWLEQEPLVLDERIIAALYESLEINDR